MNINNITKEERLLLIHAISCAIDELNENKEKSWAKNNKDSFEKSIEAYKNMNIDIKSLKTVD